MRFPLRRFYQDERQTLGTLTVGAVTLFTIERPWLENQPNVSCIPDGDYRITIVSVEGDRRIRLEGPGIPDERTLINIEVANYARELEGCIAVADGIILTDLPDGPYYSLWESKAAYSRFYDEIYKRVKKNVVCTLQISTPWQ